jgi:hypothetical protein
LPTANCGYGEAKLQLALRTKKRQGEALHIKSLARGKPITRLVPV